MTYAKLFLYIVTVFYLLLVLRDDFCDIIRFVLSKIYSITYFLLFAIIQHLMLELLHPIEIVD